MTVDYQLREEARSGDADVRQRAAVRLSRESGDETLPLAFELLGDRDWRVRKTIVDGFLRNPREEVIAGLVRCLHDPENAGKRNSATETLIRIGERAIAFIIYELGRQSDIDVRLSLVNLLGDLRNDDAYETLLSILPRETDVNLLSSTVASLGKYRRATSVPAMVALLGRRDVWLDFHIVEALGEIGDRAALPVLLPLYEEKSLRRPLLEAVGKIGDVGTLGFLLRVLAREEKLNLGALRALVRIAEADKPRILKLSERELIRRKFRDSFPREKIPALIEHLYSSARQDVRHFIIKLLGWSAQDRAIPVLIDFLRDSQCSEVAAEALADLGPAASPVILEKLRTSDDDEMTSVLLRVLHHSSDQEIVPTVIMFLDHESVQIRRLAIEMLGKTAQPGALDYLLAKLDDNDLTCQQTAVDAVCAVASRFPGAKQEVIWKLRRMLASSSIPAKLNALSVYVTVQGEGYDTELLLASKDGDPVIRQRAVTLMSRFTDKRFAEQLVLSLTDEESFVRLAAIQAIVALRPPRGVQPLITSLEDEDLWIRTAAAQALGHYQDRSALESLIRHVLTDVTPVKIAAIEALGKSAQSAAADLLKECLLDEDVEVQRASILALAHVEGEDTYGILLNCLYSEDWRMRAAAALALGNRGDKQALGPLHEAISTDSDAFVQQSSVLALGKIPDASSFPYLLRGLQNPAILDDVSELFVREKEIFREGVERAWREADSRSEPVLAAILHAMRDSGSRIEESDRIRDW